MGKGRSNTMSKASIIPKTHPFTDLVKSAFASIHPAPSPSVPTSPVQACLPGTLHKPPPMDRVLEHFYHQHLRRVNDTTLRSTNTQNKKSPCANAIDLYAGPSMRGLFHHHCFQPPFNSTVFFLGQCITNKNICVLPFVSPRVYVSAALNWGVRGH